VTRSRSHPAEHRAGGVGNRVRRALMALIARLHRWAESGAAGPAVCVWSTMQGSVVPGPSEALFLPLGLADPPRALPLAAWATAGATVGGLFAYAIGAFAFDSVGAPLLGLFGVGPPMLARLEGLFETRGAEIILLSTLSPISTKLVCIGAGAFGVPFPEFALALVAGRAARFFAIGLVLRFAGEGLMRRIEKRLGRSIEVVQ
jgi:membrane protein YqaA with SNARE-associated domain